MKTDEFITSDTHFGHEAILKLGNRPFQSVDEMDSALIAAWNAKVPPGATVYHLGDLSFHKPATTLKILAALNGTIRFVAGNHDKSNINGAVRSRFQWSKTRHVSKCDDGTRIVMDHFPLYVWEGAHKGWLHAHGHCHNQLDPDNQPRTDVGIDTTTDFAPLSYTDLMDRFAGTVYTPVDHHRP